MEDEGGGGSPQADERCPACGAAVPHGATRCPDCELSFVEEAEEPTAPVPRRERRYGGQVPGIIMLVGAVVWFVAGLGAGRIYLYPPVLAILGLVATLKGEEPRRRRGGRRVR